jgi:hypothetical protein
VGKVFLTCFPYYASIPSLQILGYPLPRRISEDDPLAGMSTSGRNFVVSKNTTPQRDGTPPLIIGEG